MQSCYIALWYTLQYIDVTTSVVELLIQMVARKPLSRNTVTVVFRLPAHICSRLQGDFPLKHCKYSYAMQHTPFVLTFSFVCSANGTKAHTFVVVRYCTYCASFIAAYCDFFNCAGIQYWTTVHATIGLLGLACLIAVDPFGVTWAGERD